MPLLSLLTAALLNLNAHALIPVVSELQDQDQRSCSFTTRMTGDGLLTYQNTKDTWKGEATLTCKSWATDPVSHTLRPSWETNQRVDVLFLGTTAYGRDVNRQVQLKLNAITSQSPSHFFLDARGVRLQMENGVMHWASENHNTLFSIEVWRDDQAAGLCESLSQGRLLIVEHK